MQIRRAVPKDIPGVDNLLNQVNLIHHKGRPDIFNVGRKYTDEELTEIFSDDKRPVFVAVDENEAVLGYAFCQMEEVKDDNIRVSMKSLYIDDICVDENIRGQQIGKRLYDYVRAFAKDAGCYHITLNVWTLNPGAQAFYERMGMKPLKTVMEDVIT